MFSSAILDVAIGLVFVFMVVSLAASAILEAIAGMVAWRSKTLINGVKDLLNDPQLTGLANQLYQHALVNPLKAMWVALRGIRTTGPMAPEIDLSNQRPAQYIFSEQVQKKLSEIRRDEALAAEQKASTAA